ncbi:MAG TPA: YcxB family protein [Chitinophagaceae bacterium]|nr:YcxB family protein [Chitinophagaceae bacterium]
MLLRFCYNKEEVIQALRFHFLHKGEIKVFRITLLILLMFAVLGYLVQLVTFAAMTGVIIMMVLLTIAFWFLLPISIYNRAATFRESIDLLCNEEGMVIGTRSGERHILWKHFHRIVETDQFFFLYRTNQSFFLIPMQAFKSQLDRENFSRLLKSKVY